MDADYFTLKFLLFLDASFAIRRSRSIDWHKANCLLGLPLRLQPFQFTGVLAQMSNEHGVIIEN